MRAGGGFKRDDVTEDTWLNTSSRLMGGTPFFVFFLRPLLEVTDTTDGDFGGEFMMTEGQYCSANCFFRLICCASSNLCRFANGKCTYN